VVGLDVGDDLHAGGVVEEGAVGLIGLGNQCGAAAQVLECLRGLGEIIAADGADAGAGAPLLLTCRTAAEGGRARLDDTAYAALLRSVLDGLTDWTPERRPAAIDVEVQRGCLPQICAQAHALDIDVVASFHDFEATPADEVLEEVLARMAREGADLAKIAGQKPVVTKARKAIAGFKIREGYPIGCMVTLRGVRMYEFLDRLITVALPRVRDFRGVSGRSFDGRGNYNFGVKEQIMFPEIEYDKVDALRGLNISITTTAKTDEEAKALLSAFRFPFRN